MNAAQVLLVLSAPPALEETLIDWLLATGDGVGFTSQAVNGHSSQHGHLSLAEQVTGRQQRIQFQIHADRLRIDALLTDLQRDFAGADVHYWLSPLLGAGHLGTR